MTAAADSRTSDASHVLHPNGQLTFGAAAPALLIEGGSGCWVWDSSGRRYLDALSGLVCVNVGYGRRELVDAMGEVADLGYGTLFFGRTHRHVAALSEQLAAITPGGIGRFFFTSGGSEANDTALRLARSLWVAEGEPQRIKVLARRGSYHGATLATMSAGGEPSRHASIGVRMPGFVDLGQPVPGFDAVGELRGVIEREGPETVAALIAEPIAYQAGMVVPGAEYWPAVRSLCDEHGILLIVDEVLTGFGRTGRMFGIEHFGVEPDLMTMSKGLTSGYLPLGAVGVSDAVHQRLDRALSGSDGILGFTSSGHPACSAVALANLRILQREDLVARAAEMGRRLDALVGELAGASSAIVGWRVRGLLAGVDVSPRASASLAERSSFCRRVVAAMAERGVFARPFAGTVAIAPPLVVDEAELGVIVDALRGAIADVD